MISSQTLAKELIELLYVKVHTFIYYIILHWVIMKYLFNITLGNNEILAAKNASVFRAEGL